MPEQEKPKKAKRKSLKRTPVNRQPKVKSVTREEFDSLVIQVEKCFEHHGKILSHVETLANAIHRLIGEVELIVTENRSGVFGKIKRMLFGK